MAKRDTYGKLDFEQKLAEDLKTASVRYGITIPLRTEGWFALRQSFDNAMKQLSAAAGVALPYDSSSRTAMAISLESTRLTLGLDVSLSTYTIAATDATKLEGNTGTTAYTFTVTRAALFVGASTIDWAVTGNGANPATATDFGGAFPSGTLSFAAGETIKTITVLVVGDATVEQDESFRVTLSNAQPGASIIIGSATGTILNDDVAPTPTVTLSNALAISEGNTDTTNFVYTVTRSSSVGAVTVAWAFSPGTTSASDFAGAAYPIGGTISMANGVSSATFVVQVQGDTTVEADEQFSVSIAAPTGYGSGANMTATGTILNDDAAPAAAITTADSAASPNALTTSDTQTWSHTVSPAANRILIVALQLTINDTITSVTYGGQAMSLIDGNVAQNDSGRYQNVSLWQLANPPLGTATITAKRAGTASARFLGMSATLRDAKQQAAIAPQTFFNATDAGSYSPTGPVAQSAGHFALFLFGTELVTQSNDLVLDSSLTEIGSGNKGTGNSMIRWAYRTAPTAGAAVSPGAVTITSTSGTTTRNLGMVAATFEPLPHQDVQSVYYVSSTGSDTNDGYADGTSFASLEPLSTLPQPAPTRFNFKRGGIYRRTSAQPSGTSPLSLTGNGTSIARQAMQAYGTGPLPMLSGAIAVPTGWGAISSGEASAFAVANGQKRAMGKTVSRWAAPCIDGAMLYPAQWSPNGFPTCITDWAEYQDGTNSVRRTASVQKSGGATGVSADLTKEVAYSTNSSAVTIHITHPDIATHYGNLPSDALNGCCLAFLSAANVENNAVVTNYDYANSRITATVGYSSVSVPHQGVDPWWCVRFSPYDLALVGQYALNGGATPLQTMYAIWPAGTTKSVMSADRGFIVSADYTDLVNLNIGRIGQDTESTGTRHTLVLSGTGISLTNVTVGQSLDPSRPSGIGGTTAPLVDLNINGLTGDELFTNGLLRFQSDCSNATINDVVARNLGRSAVFFGAGSAQPSRYNSITNVDVNDLISVHGNGLTTYSGSHHITFAKFTAMGCTNPVTTQVKGAPVLVTPRANSWSQFIISHPRFIDGSIGGTYIFRIDSGETGSKIDKGIAVIAGSTAFYFGVGTGPDNDATVYNHNGMEVKRCVIEGVNGTSTAPGGLTGVKFKWCVLFYGDGIGGGITRSGLEALGATFEDCLHITLANGSRASGSNGAWNGTLTRAMQEVITRADDWTSAAPTYAGWQVGPDKWGPLRNKGPWQIPAYNAASAKVDLWITTDAFRAGWQANKQMGSLCGARPGSSLSLPAGQGNNSMFTLDPRGLIRPNANVPAGTYSIVARETGDDNATRDTVIAVSFT